MQSARKHFFKLQLPMFLMGLFGIFYVTYTHEYSWLLLTYVMWFLMYVMGESIFYHRYFAHASFETHEWVARTFAVLATMAGFGSPITYRAIHMGWHHPYSDKPQDIHSPVQYGFWHACGGWYLTDVQIPIVYAKKLLRNPFYVGLEKHLIKMWWSVTILFTLIDWKIAVFGIGLPGLISHICMALTNGVSHSWGSRRYDTDDNSRNIWWLSWFTLNGASVLQNNHHAYPCRYYDSHAWYELDVGKWIIPLIATKINYPVKEKEQPLVKK
jgi:stearoyl-CoA desaturase (delta-9 desaturase)